MKFRAHAKINFGLRILGKRPDGYHDLETVYHEIDLFDEIELEAQDQLTMSADSILVPVDESNLCLRAAQLLQADQKVKQGASIHLKKNIPIGAGLGGGSSDAAMVLLGLAQLWNLKLTDKKLQQLAIQVGSDVPFFLKGGSAYATGRGEVLNYFPLNIPYWIVLVTPPVHVSTAWAYNSIKPLNGKATGLQDVIVKKIQKPEELVDSVKNDFESLVFQTYPEIHKTKERLLEMGAVFALMSGSGSSVFGLFKETREAEQVAAEFPKTYTVAITEPHFSPRRDKA